MNPAVEARAEIEKAVRQRKFLVETGRSQKRGDVSVAIDMITAWIRSHECPSKKSLGEFKDRLWAYLCLVVIGGKRGKKQLERINNLIAQVS